MKASAPSARPGRLTFFEFTFPTLKHIALRTAIGQGAVYLPEIFCSEALRKKCRAHALPTGESIECEHGFLIREDIAFASQPKEKLRSALRRLMLATMSAYQGGAIVQTSAAV